MKHPRVPNGTTAPEGAQRLSVTATQSDETGNDKGGTYVFRVFGQEVFLLFGQATKVETVTSANGFPLTEADGPVCFEVPDGWRFRAICTATETSSLAWYRAGDR